MSEPRPPDVLTVQWCPKCGWEVPRGWRESLRHYAGTGPGLCPGVPVELTYVLTSTPKEQHL